jgi:hypothetical protein
MNRSNVLLTLRVRKCPHAEREGYTRTVRFANTQCKINLFSYFALRTCYSEPG